MVKSNFRFSQGLKGKKPLRSGSELQDRVSEASTSNHRRHMGSFCFATSDYLSEGNTFSFPHPARPFNHVPAGVIYIHNVFTKAHAAEQQLQLGGLLCWFSMQLLLHTHRQLFHG